MSNTLVETNDMRLANAITELQNLILEQYPEATFAVQHGDDPTGTYVLASVEAEDMDEVIDVFIDRLIDLQIEHGLRLHVLPLIKSSR